MNNPAPERHLSRSLLLYCLGLGLIYFLISAHRSVAVWSRMGDEPLFFREALNIVKGHWLGDYNVDTLVKGPVYPLFLAINNATGLSIGIGQGMFYFASVIYFSAIFSRVMKSRTAFIAVSLALLFAPVLFEVSMQRLLRDTFYATVTVFYFATLFNFLLLRTHRSKWILAAGLGLLAGLLWMTREETIWIAPATFVAILLAAVKLRPVFSHLLAELAVAAAGFAAILLTIALLNLHYYGGFITLEVTGSDFQSAMVALQRASYPDVRPYVPVPKAARLRIYKESPTFARLQSFLDPAAGPSPWSYGCEMGIASTCGDILGGHFLWALRDGASRLGEHSDPKRAAAFYRSIGAEVKQACTEHRLSCGPWLPPLMPYATKQELLDLDGHVLKGLRVIAMSEPMSFEPLTSNFGDDKEVILSLLNHPRIVEDHRSVVVKGWYRGDGNSWFSVTGTEDPVVVSRSSSLDLVTAFSDPRLTQNRFTFTTRCSINGPCPLIFTDEHQVTIQLDLNMLTPGSLPFGKGTLYIETITTPQDALRTVPDKLFGVFTKALSRIKPFFSWLWVLGSVAFIGIAGWTLYRREISVGFIVVTTLAVAVLSRVFLLSLMDVTAAPIRSSNYHSSETILGVAFAVGALFESAQLLGQYRVAVTGRKKK